MKVCGDLDDNLTVCTPLWPVSVGVFGRDGNSPENYQ